MAETGTRNPHTHLRPQDRETHSDIHANWENSKRTHSVNSSRAFDLACLDTDVQIATQ